MKTMSRVMVLLVLIAGVLGSGAVVHSRSRLPARALAAAPPCPPATQNCCLIQIHKRFKQGQRTGAFRITYNCPLGTTSRGVAGVQIVLTSAGQPCDEKPALIPNGSRLTVNSGGFFRRKDGLAHFCGPFTITMRNQVLYTGTLETLDRVGSHAGVPGVGDCERCNQEEHLEGWLTGAGTRLGGSRYLRALIVAHVTNTSDDGSKAVLDGAINGVLIDCPIRRVPFPPPGARARTSHRHH
jgi:hypothetical protein